MLKRVELSLTEAHFLLRKTVHEHNRLVKLPLRKGERMSERALQLADLKRLHDKLQKACDR